MCILSSGIPSLHLGNRQATRDQRAASGVVFDGRSYNVGIPILGITPEPVDE